MMDKNISLFECDNCNGTFTNDPITNYKLPQGSRYRVSKRIHINGKAYCKHCAKPLKESIKLNRDAQIKQIADSTLGIPTNCEILGTCDILKAHKEVLKDDPERLTGEFLINLICGEEKLKKYQLKKEVD